MRLLSAGFSHSGSYSAVLEGFPANVIMDKDFIDSQLFLRQNVPGRSSRMNTEKDKITFLSGIIDSKTTGAPISFLIESADKKRVSFSAIRPNHADFAGAVKYGFSDLSLISERASARETVNTVAVGALCRTALSALKIQVKSRVLCVGGCFDSSLFNEIIKAAADSGDTVGGSAEVVISGVPAGFGGFSQYDIKLDGLFAAAIMSLPAVKAVEIGLGTGFSSVLGSNCADILTKDGRQSNNCGGIDGGMTNGSDIVLRFSVKPVPSLNRPLDTVDITTLKKAKTPVLRADTSAVFAAAIAAEGAAAFVILDAILASLGGDTIEEVTERFIKKRANDPFFNKDGAK